MRSAPRSAATSAVFSLDPSFLSSPLRLSLLSPFMQLAYLGRVALRPAARTALAASRSMQLSHSSSNAGSSASLSSLHWLPPRALLSCRPRAFSTDSNGAAGSSSQNAGTSGTNAGHQSSPHAPKATTPPPWSAPDRRDVPPLPLDRIAGEGIGTLFEVRPDPIAVTPFQKAKLKATWGVRYAFFAALSGLIVLCGTVIVAYYVYNPEAEIRQRTMKLLRADPLVHTLIGKDVKDMSHALMRPRDMMAWHERPWLPIFSHPVTMQFVVQGKKGRAQILVSYLLHPKWHKDPNAKPASSDKNDKNDKSDKSESAFAPKRSKHNKPLTDNHRWELLYLSMESRGQGQIVLQDNRTTIGQAVEPAKHKAKAGWEQQEPKHS